MSTEKPIQRYDKIQHCAGSQIWDEIEPRPDGDFVKFEDHRKVLASEYGRGVTAGKLEAGKYTPEERDNYGKVIAQYDEWRDLKTKLAEVAAERDRLKAELEELRNRPLSHHQFIAMLADKFGGDMKEPL